MGKFGYKQALSTATQVFRWYSESKKGRVILEDEPQTGHPITEHCYHRKCIQKEAAQINDYKADEIQNIKYTDLSLHKYPGVHKVMHMTPTDGFHMF